MTKVTADTNVLFTSMPPYMCQIYKTPAPYTAVLNRVSLYFFVLCLSSSWIILILSDYVNRTYFTLPQPCLGVKLDGRMTNGWVLTITWFKHYCEL